MPSFFLIIFVLLFCLTRETYSMYMSWNGWTQWYPVQAGLYLWVSSSCWVYKTTGIHFRTLFKSLITKLILFTTYLICYMRLISNLTYHIMFTCTLFKLLFHYCIWKKIWVYQTVRGQWYRSWKTITRFNHRIVCAEPRLSLTGLFAWKPNYFALEFP